MCKNDLNKCHVGKRNIKRSSKVSVGLNKLIMKSSTEKERNMSQNNKLNYIIWCVTKFHFEIAY